MSKAPEDRALGTCRHEGMPRDAKKRRRGEPSEIDLIDLSADPSSSLRPTRSRATRISTLGGSLPESRENTRRDPAPGPSSSRPPCRGSSGHEADHRRSAPQEQAAIPTVSEPAAADHSRRQRRRRHNLWGELLEGELEERDESYPPSWRQARDAQRDAQQAEEEREHTALNWRMEELEREELVAAAAAAAASNPALPSTRDLRSSNRHPRRQPSGPPPQLPPTGARGVRRPRWPAPTSFADAMAGLFSFEPEEHPGAAHMNSILSELAAMHAAMLGVRSGALPPHLLFTDRDFTDEDYEALLELDKGVENRHGASKDAINAIPIERVSRGSGAAAAAGDCPICLEAYKGGECMRRLPCKHCYHKGCIDRWLRNKATCPICQRSVKDE